MTAQAVSSLEQTLRYMLRAYQRDPLRQIARATGFTPPSAQREELIPALAHHLAQLDVVAASLAQLDDDGRAVLRALVALGGYAVTAPFGPFMAARLRRSATSSAPPPSAINELLTRLATLGLVFTEPLQGVQPARTLQPGDYLFVSPGAMAAIGLVEEDVPAAFDQPPPGVQVLLTSVDPLQRDAYFYWSEVRERPPAVTARGLVAKRDVARLAAALGTPGGEPPGTEDTMGRLFFLRLLLQALGLLRHDGANLQAAEPAFFRRTPADRAALAFAAWRAGAWWTETTHIAGVQVVGYGRDDSQGYPLTTAARLLVLNLLRVLSAGRWYSFAHLSGRARIARGDFIVANHNAAPYLNGAMQGTTLDYAFTLQWARTDDPWEAVEGGYLRAVVTEPLYWLGIVDVALEGATPLAFRITPLGLRLLRNLSPQDGPDDPAAVEAHGRVIVQPNFDVLVYEPVSPLTLTELDRFATRQGTGNVLHYHLSRASLYKAQQGGLDAAAAIAFLERISGQDVPQNVRYSLLDWQRLHERLTVHGGVTLCQVADPAILDALLTAPPAGLEDVRRLAPTVAMLPPQNLEALRSYLEGRGYIAPLVPSPAETPAGQDSLEAPPGALSLNADGVISVTTPLPTLYLHGALVRFADLLPPSRASRPQAPRYALTSASITRATAENIQVDTITRWLETLSDHPLPPALLDRIKSWADYYGPLTLARQVILRMDRPERLAELLTDPVVGPLLTPLAPAAGLAGVADESLDDLRRALRAKGIAIADLL